jgi:hypothetical protein
VLVTVVRVLPGVGSSGTAGLDLTRCPGCDGTTAGGLSRCRVPLPPETRGPAPGDGSGPRPPFGPTPSGRLPDRRPLSTGRSGPSRVSPPKSSPSPLATTAVGPGTRTALAHCAVPGPKPAGVAEGDSSWVSCGGRRYLGGATRCCQLPADLHRCAKVQVGDVTSDRTISLCGQRIGRVGPDALPAHHPNGPLTGKDPVRMWSQPAPRRCRRPSPRRSAGRAPPRPTGLATAPLPRRPLRGRRPGRPGTARGCGCRPG